MTLGLLALPLLLLLGLGGYLVADIGYTQVRRGNFIAGLIGVLLSILGIITLCVWVIVTS